MVHFTQHGVSVADLLIDRFYRLGNFMPGVNTFIGVPLFSFYADALEIEILAFASRIVFGNHFDAGLAKGKIFSEILG